MVGVVEREKNPYPSTQDPAYEKAIRADVAEILADASAVIPQSSETKKGRLSTDNLPFNVAGLEASARNSALAGGAPGLDLTLAARVSITIIDASSGLGRSDDFPVTGHHKVGSVPILPTSFLVVLFLLQTRDAQD
jgi:hypothetical protein